MKFESERAFCKDKNSILTPYITCFEFHINTQVGILRLSQNLTEKCQNFVKWYDTTEVQSNIDEVYSSFASIYITPVITCI